MAYNRSQYQSYYNHSQKKYLEDVCKYYDSFQRNSKNCIRGQGCDFHHLSSNELTQIIQSSFNKQTLRKIAFDYEKNGLFRCSSIAFQRLLELDKSVSSTYYGYAKALAGLGEFDEAKIHYLKAIDIQSDHRSHSQYAYFLHTKLKDYQQAKTHFITALEYDAKNAHVHGNYAQLLEEGNNLNEAEYHYLECLRIDSVNRSGLYHAALFYHKKKKDYKESKKYFDRLIQLEEYHEIKKWFEYCDYGLLLKDMGLHNEALNNLNTALMNCFDDRDKSHIYYEIGRIHDDQKNTKSAKFHYEKACKLNSNKYEKHYNEFLKYHHIENKSTMGHYDGNTANTNLNNMNNMNGSNNTRAMPMRHGHHNGSQNRGPTMTPSKDLFARYYSENTMNNTDTKPTHSMEPKQIKSKYLRYPRAQQQNQYVDNNMQSKQTNDQYRSYNVDNYRHSSFNQTLTRPKSPSKHLRHPPPKKTNNIYNYHGKYSSYNHNQSRPTTNYNHDYNSNTNENITNNRYGNTSYHQYRSYHNNNANQYDNNSKSHRTTPPNKPTDHNNVNIKHDNNNARDQKVSASKVQEIKDQLVSMGFTMNYIERAIKVYTVKPNLRNI